MQVINIPAGSLAVLSGLPGAGKSHLLQNSRLPHGIVQSSDALRRAFGGESVFIAADGHVVSEPLQSVSLLVWETIEKVVEERLKQGLTTIVDATLVADEIPGSFDRARFAKMAQQAGVPFKVIIVDTPMERVLAQNASRSARVPERAIQEFLEGVTVPAQGKAPAYVLGGYQRTSRFPHEVVTSDAVVRVVAPLQLEGENWDIVGDIHGLLRELRALLEKLGYEECPDGLHRHRDGRRLLFLGDLVDRGPESIETLRFVMRMCAAGLAKVVMGNHDAKLVAFWDTAKQEKLDFWRSFSNAQTGMELLRLPEDEGERIIAFLRSLPHFAMYENDTQRVVFAHADAKAFNLMRTPRDEVLHGASNWGRFDSDAAMQRYLDTYDFCSAELVPPTKRQYYIRGHIPGTSWQVKVVSLDAHAFQNGSLLAMRLDDYLKGKSSVVPLPTTYDFNAVQAARVAPYVGLQELVTNKLATVSTDTRYGLRLFKYAKSVFYEHLWGTNSALLRARGHVYDVAGNVVSQPFDKVFNYKEEGAGLDLAPETRVRAVVKLNGFLGVVSPHPVMRSDLLVHTTGSFESDFVGYIKDFITGPVRGKMLKLFSKRPLTLMFEVLHEKDPHIVPYEKEDHGLHLIGAREIRQGSSLLTEGELDDLAAELGFRRPEHFETTFGELLKLNAACHHEGHMVRLLDDQETMVLKLKGPVYLTSKFLARMSDGKWKHLFANPASFKLRIDEEFYSLVDTLTTKFSLEAILQRDEQEKLALIRELVL
ncbi:MULTISPECIES: AAA family ATPase [unclassified Variovorax]|uniref:AAA family ATPase n=1 Tax=unclassified Variovorax TaxID=663243 RepID=UPI0013185876|nr:MULTISPECIES: AAA family ATPase [unclassified Variovorax]VTU41630.1 Bis(5'-nucleosyl)-tetraphosphatase PrpE [asymmetrical] [Variovorax sp. SRS16]VTU41663.1 Bis(5'-nucleosyl)-tetraphosphatase PrpE [asymmetrical] [Variovorax sp. PBL-E5]VTU44744.1 Bis(5'-nucleosyl)-tetraphosphatase PrpE [asymmetrical] [Variovorax sp. PBL-H6]